MDDPSVPERVEALARLIGRDLAELTDDELVTMIRTLGELRKTAPERIGRALAVLYMRDNLSWPEIGRLTGVPATTAYGWAKDYLPPDRETELGPRRGRPRDR